jgi:hypothetical protein
MSKSADIETPMTKSCTPVATKPIAAAIVRRARSAGPEHQVVTVEGGPGAFRKTPCGGCPWVRENTGEFPAQAFVHSANTAYDMASNLFACHESGVCKPQTCAGFLLRGAGHNLSVRLKIMQGALDLAAVKEDGRPLFDSYREMAVSNGVDPAHPALARCRDR